MLLQSAQSFLLLHLKMTVHSNSRLSSSPPASSCPDHRSNSQAKQRASILWLLSKACDCVIPPELKEPFYKDHGGEERLKPQIQRALADGELYCLALANIYADPNYNNLNHTGILTVLMRKGIYVQEPQENALTESVLSRTNPIKMVSQLRTVAFIEFFSFFLLFSRQKSLMPVCLSVPFLSLSSSSSSFHSIPSLTSYT